MSESVRAPKGPARPTPFVVFLGIACVVLMAMDVGLALRVRHLEARVAELTSVADRVKRPKLIEGDRFPEVTLFDAQGHPIRLTGPVEQEPTLLLISSRDCDYCEVVKPIWRRAARIARAGHVRVLGLVLNATPGSLAGEDVPYPLLGAGDDAWSLIERIPGVPGAIFIEPDGAVARAFYGADQVGLENAVEEFVARH